MPCPKDILPNAGEMEEEKTAADAHAESDYHRTDEQVIKKKGTHFFLLFFSELCYLKCCAISG